MRIRVPFSRIMEALLARSSFFLLNPTSGTQKLQNQAHDEWRLLFLLGFRHYTIIWGKEEESTVAENEGWRMETDLTTIFVTPLGYRGNRTNLWYPSNKHRQTPIATTDSNKIKAAMSDPQGDRGQSHSLPWAIPCSRRTPTSSCHLHASLRSTCGRVPDIGYISSIGPPPRFP